MEKKYIIAIGLLLSLGSTNHSFGAAAAEDTEEQDQQWLGARLIKAVENNDLQTVQELIDQKAPLNYESREEHTLGMTPLMLASTLGFLDIVHLLLKQADILIEKPHKTQNNDALMYAIGAGQENIVRTLIAAGACNSYYLDDPEAGDHCNNEGKTIWTIQVEGDRTEKTRKQMTKVIEQSIKKYKSAHKLGRQLLISIVKGDIKSVKKLLNSNAMINFHPQESAISDTTPLILASSQNSLDMVRLLIKARANVNMKDGIYNQTALMAHFNKNLNHNLEIVNTLIKANADLEARDGSGDTALLWAIQENTNNEILQMLIFAGARLDVHNNEKNTAWNIPISHPDADKTREQMNGTLQRIVDEKQNTKNLIATVGKHLPPLAITLVLDYEQENTFLRTLQERLFKQYQHTLSLQETIIQSTQLPQVLYKLVAEYVGERPVTAESNGEEEEKVDEENVHTDTNFELDARPRHCTIS